MFLGDKECVKILGFFPFPTYKKWQVLYTHCGPVMSNIAIKDMTEPVCSSGLATVLWI